MNNTELPKLETKASALAKMSPEEKTSTLLLSLFSQSRFTKLPEFDNQWEVKKKAEQDWKFRDYGNFMDYIDSLESIADHWQDYAKELHQFLLSEGYLFDESSMPTGEKLTNQPNEKTI